MRWRAGLDGFRGRNKQAELSIGVRLNKAKRKMRRKREEKRRDGWEMMSKRMVEPIEMQ